MRRISLLLIFGLIALLSACGGVEPHPPVHITIAGSTSMQPLLQELAEAYTHRHEYVTIDVQPGGSRLGVKAVREGTADIGMVSRELSDDASSRHIDAEDKLELKRREDVSEEERIDLQATVIAEDGIAILVNAQNGVDSLSLADIERIFAGRILDWSELGSESGEILVVSREEGSGTREAFEEMVMMGKRVTPTAVVMPSSEAMREFVADNPQAIGYISMGLVSSGVKAVKVNGVEPSPETVRQGEYPIVRPFLLLTRLEPNQEVRAFIEFILSPAGQAVVGRRHGRVK